MQHIFIEEIKYITHPYRQGTRSESAMKDTLKNNQVKESEVESGGRWACHVWLDQAQEITAHHRPVWLFFINYNHSVFLTVTISLIDLHFHNLQIFRTRIGSTVAGQTKDKSIQTDTAHNITEN